MGGTAASGYWISSDTIFDGFSLLKNHLLRIENGHCVGLAHQNDVPSQEKVTAHFDGTIGPGFLDLQVNGGGDVLFNTEPTRQGIGKIIAAHREFGTAALLPTVITDAPEVMAQAVEAVLQSWGMPGLLGLHIEGPHIATSKRGTHDARFIRPLCDQTIGLVQRLRTHNIPVKITVAPEMAKPDQIENLARMGAIVSLGHSNASCQDVQAALAAGASCFTHLHNAMSQMQARAPGMVGAAINSDAYAGLICDGIHVDYQMLALTLRARARPDRNFIVSDAMPSVGGSGQFKLYNMQICVHEGRLINEEGNLAGAHVTMGQSVANLIKLADCHPKEALSMASSVPAALLGCPERASLVGLAERDILCMSAEWSTFEFFEQKQAALAR